MKEQPIQLYFRSWSNRYYLTHPWKLFKDIRTYIKNYRHRARYGYAWVDLWNMDTYLDQLIPNMLDELADRSHGWPQGEEWPEFEDWQKELHVIAELWRLTACDPLADKDEIEYHFAVYRDKVPLEPIKHLPQYTQYLLTDEEIAAIDGEQEQWKRVSLEIETLRRKIFTRISSFWGTLWD